MRYIKELREQVHSYQQESESKFLKLSSGQKATKMKLKTHSNSVHHPSPHLQITKIQRLQLSAGPTLDRATPNSQAKQTPETTRMQTTFGKGAFPRPFSLSDNTAAHPAPELSDAELNRKIRSMAKTFWLN